MTKKTRFIILILSILFLYQKANSQPSTTNPNYSGSSVNTITTAVPLLMIAPDSRGSGMGDLGVATSPDANSIHWNPAKLAQVDKDFGLAISYSPWLRELIGDISLSYLAGYKRIDKRQTLGMSLLYFSLGNIQFTDVAGSTIRDYTPSEFSLDFSYSLMLSKNLSGGVALRYIYSNLTGGTQLSSGAETHAGNAFAGDVSAYYQNMYKMGDKDGTYAFGFNISNMGTKISYTDDSNQNFIPTNLRVGGLISLTIDQYNSISLTSDLNKLLVPSPPVYDPAHPGDANYILKGKNPNVSVPAGMIQSFYDAPGGMTEEMHEITYSVGTEYWYSKQFAVRGGYFFEHPTKGNRKFVTLGLGLRLNVFALDFSYLLPTSQHNPLQNTLRFSLAFNFEGLKKKKKDETDDK